MLDKWREERGRIRRELGEVIDRIGAEGQGGTAMRLRAALDRIVPEEG